MSQRVYEIKATEDSPYVSMDAGSGEFWIKGVSMPENAFEFYSPLIEEFDSRFKNGSAITINIHLDYLNSMSNKQLLRLLLHVEKLGLKATVNWIYSKTDDLMYQKGEEMDMICENMNFQMKPQD